MALNVNYVLDGAGTADPNNNPSPLASTSDAEKTVDGDDTPWWYSMISKLIGSAVDSPLGNQSRTNQLIESVNNGSMDPQDALSEFLKNQDKYRMDGQTYEWLYNMLSDQRTNEAYKRDIQAILDKAQATQEAAIQTGLNPSAYMMGQGFGQGTSVGAARSDTSNPIGQQAINKFNQKASTARTLLGLLGGMASAGIYGASMYAGKKAVADLTTAASRDAASIRAAGMVDAAKARRVSWKTKDDRYGREYIESYYY